MRRNELFTNTAIETDVKLLPNTADKSNDGINIPDECLNEFIKAMKIGYYKEFYKQKLITAEQLERLIAMQDNAPTEQAA